MNAWKPILLVIALMAALPILPSEGATPCRNSVKGDWAFGVAPKGCDTLNANSKLSLRHDSLIFVERAQNERTRYMTEMHAFLRDASDYYLEQRRKSISSSERLAWRRFMMTIAHQESYWSHLRNSKGKLKFMRGDSGHGYGMLQVDERWHTKMTKSGKMEDLTTSLMYGMDMSFQAWEKAAKAKCVKKGNFEQRARAAYSAYNAGPKKVCRWTNSKGKWAKNDKGFWKKYQSQEWLKHVAKRDQRSSLDVECLVEGGYKCGAGVHESEQEEVDSSVKKFAALELPSLPLYLRSTRGRQNWS